MVTKSYIIGLPASGKTTFLGALGYSLLSNTVEENVYEIDSIDNLDYIKSLANTWSQCKEMDRTKRNSYVNTKLQLKDKDNNKLELYIPDQSGEEFEYIVNNRSMNNTMYNEIAVCDNIFLFVNPSKISNDLFIKDLAPEYRNVSQEKVSALDNSIMHEQTQYVSILQDVYALRKCRTKIKIVISAWDEYELTGGLYFGDRYTKEIDGVTTAVDTLTYNENEIRRIAIKAFDIAMKRRKSVISVDKANVLDSSRLWRKVVEEVAKDYPEVTLTHMLVDNCAMQLVMNPGQFDVILTENMFGDILSDEASMITGSIGMLSSASLNEGKFGLYEPSHGSAPDIAGKDIANPIATILSAAMMLRYSFDLDKEAKAIEDAVQQVLTEGYRTVDIMADGCKQVGTTEMGKLICERIK